LEGLDTEIERRVTGALLASLYPEEGLLRRDLYPKHMEFFRAGATYRERLAMCANRIGKTFGMGGYESTLHLTGRYPQWWEGRRFEHPIEAWAAGKTNQTTRDIVQATLFGKVKREGTQRVLTGSGLIPAGLIGRPTWYKGSSASDLIDTVPIRHISGGWSTLGMKSYQQGRGSFEGTAKHLIWMDEEPKEEIYGECVIRTATTDGIIMLTFTPLEGLSKVVLAFVKPDLQPPSTLKGDSLTFGG
jgi:phage terminase large subunit-like protein